MKKMKRFVSLLVVLTTLAASAAFSLSAYAEETTLPSVEVTDEDWLRVEKLEAFGAITNEYEDIGMYVSRRQMVDIIVHYLRLQVSGTNPSQSPFVDVSVSDVSIDGIVTLHSTGVITGDENLRFHPDNYLTYNEALVFVINAVGHKLFATREGGYPTGYHRIAIKNSMLAGLDFDSGKEYIPLCDVYKLLESAMDVGAVVPVSYTDGSLDYYVSSDDTFMSDLYDIEAFKGIITGSEDTRLDSALSNLSDEQIEINGVIYDTPGYVYATSLGRAVTYYLRKTTDSDYNIAYIEEDDKVNNLVKVDSDALLPEKTTASRIYYTDEKDNERHIDFDVNVDVIYNGRCYSGYGKIENVLPVEGYIEALDNTGDGEAEVLFVYSYKNIIVDSADAHSESITAKDSGKKISLDTTDNTVRIYVKPDNKKISIASVKQNDVATIMESKSSPKLITIYISRETVSGTVTEVSDESGFLIDGTYYKTSSDYADSKITVGTTAVFSLNANGRIVGMDRSGIKGNEAYAVVAAIDYEESNLANEISLKLYTSDGTFITAKLSDSVKIDSTRYEPNGKDFETVLEILSSGATDDSGKYYIDSAYVVRYLLSGDEITYLDTGKTEEEGKLREFATGTQIVVRYDGMIKLARLTKPSVSAGAIYANYIEDETCIFFVPADGNLDDEKSYSIQKDLASDHHYQDDGFEKSYVTPIDNFAAYDLNTSDIYSAEAILLRGGSAAVEMNDTTAEINVVTKITNALNADGEPTYKLYLNKNRNLLLADEVNYKMGTAAATSTKIDASDVKTVLKPGTVIQYGTDVDGNINGFVIVSDYDAETSVVTSYFDEVVLGSDTYARVVGEVAENNVAKKVMSVISDGGSEYLIFNGDSPTVYIYRSGNEQVTIGTVSDITSGDQVVIRLDDYFAAKEVIIFK